MADSTFHTLPIDRAHDATSLQFPINLFLRLFLGEKCTIDSQQVWAGKGLRFFYLPDPSQTQKGSNEHIYFHRDTQYANFQGNPLCQALTKGISRKICILCVHVKIKNVCWNLFVYGSCFRMLAVILFQIFVFPTRTDFILLDVQFWPCPHVPRVGGSGNGEGM